MEDNQKKTASGSDPNSVPPDPEELKAPLNSTETSTEESHAQAPESSPSSTDAAPQELPAPDAENSAPVEEVSEDKAELPETVTAQEPLAPRKSLAYQLFSPETRLGQIMRPVLRWLAAIAGLFALGLLAGYILIYQPTQRELEATLARLATTNQVVSQTEMKLDTAQSSLDQAQLSLKQVQNKLEAAASENALLIVMVDVSTARVALVEKDGAAAKAAIEQAQSNFNKALPYIETQDKVLSDLLKSRLDLSAKELVSDPQAALSDLGKVSSDLANLHQKIFEK